MSFLISHATSLLRDGVRMRFVARLQQNTRLPFSVHVVRAVKVCLPENEELFSNTRPSFSFE